MTDEKIKFTQDALEAIRKRLEDYKRDTKESWESIGKKIGRGTSTLQAFAAGKYLGDNQDLAEEVAKWFRSTEVQAALFSDDWVPSFQPTSTAKAIHAQLQWAKRGKMITLIGDPGIGKTMALNKFAQDHSNVWVVTASPSRGNYNAFMFSILDAMNVSVGGRSGFHLSQRIRSVLRGRDGPLLCIDEAQHMGERLLEEVRSIHDDTKCGIAFVGNREVTRTIDGSRTAQYAQRSSRISTRDVFSKPIGYDVKIMLEAWGVTDPLEIEFLTRIAMRPGGGALRQMSQVLELAQLLAHGKNTKRVFDHIKTAADQLQAGMVA